ncbi:hypothetical protein ACWDV4_01670 [Micromonospora sp. NPDC003197]
MGPFSQSIGLPTTSGQARPDRTTMARSLVDAPQWARTDDEAQTILAAGCQQRRATPAEIETVILRMPRTRWRGYGGYTSRSMAHTTWTPGTGQRTCAGRTRSG